jgi:hypothetical protein
VVVNHLRPRELVLDAAVRGHLILILEFATAEDADRIAH